MTLPPEVRKAVFQKCLDNQSGAEVPCSTLGIAPPLPGASDNMLLHWREAMIKEWGEAGFVYISTDLSRAMIRVKLDPTKRSLELQNRRPGG